MDKQKQIEEMAKLLFRYQEDTMVECEYVAKVFCNEGYRKIQDDEIVITKDEYESLRYQAMITESDQQHWLDGYKVGYRDGVVSVQTKAKKKIDEISKELIGGK